MTTAILKSMTQEGTHAVGTLSGIRVRTLANGAKVTGDPVDNWTIVELAGFNEEGERLCKAVTAKDKKGYLVASPEQRFLGEDISHFYNDVDEFVRPVLLEADYTRFELSNFALNAGVTEVKNGQVAHFDVATKKYILSEAGTAHADYATSAYQFEVVADLDDTAGNFLQPTIRLMCTKAA